jgi:hypothetical protein
VEEFISDDNENDYFNASLEQKIECLGFSFYYPNNMAAIIASLVVCCNLGFYDNFVSVLGKSAIDVVSC